MKQTLVLSTIIIFGFVAIFGLSRFLDAHKTPLSDEITDADLAFKGETLKKISLGFDGLIADYYWMNALQYMGGKIDKSDSNFIDIEHLQDLKPRLLYANLDTATTLDPQFLTAYSFGAVVLPAIDKAQAIKLTEKGIAANPNEWRLYHQLGYIYWRSGDFKNAAEIYAKGAEIAGAPSWMKIMSAKMNADGGSVEIAKLIYQELYDEAQDTQTKEMAAKKLLELEGK